MPSMTPTSTCTCGASVADDKLHFFSCKLLKRRQVTDRHNRIASTLKTLADLGGFGCILEPAIYDRVPGATRKRPDVEFLSPTGSLFGDVTVCNPAAPSRIERRMNYATSIAAVESQKKTKYVRWLQAQNQPGLFCPLALSIFGGFGEGLRNCLNVLDKDVSLTSRQTLTSLNNSWLTYARNLISVTLVKENAAIVHAGWQNVLRVRQLLFN